MRSALGIGGGVLAALLTLLSSSEVTACSAPACIAASVVPTGPVPANLPGFYWRPQAHRGVPLDFESNPPRLIGGTSPPALAVESGPDGGYWLKPTSPLPVGASFEFELPSGCDAGGTATPTVTVLAAAPLPTSLRLLQVIDSGRSELHLGTALGSCTRPVDSVWVDVGLSPGDDPWASAWLFTTFVDGEPYRPMGGTLSPDYGTSWRGRGVDRLYSICGGANGTFEVGLSEGAHRVWLQAELPGGPTFRTTALNVELWCDGRAWEVGTDRTEDLSDELSTADPSCGCRATAGGADSGWGLLGLVLVGSVRRCSARGVPR